jgi:hypothetical protein
VEDIQLASAAGAKISIGGAVTSVLQATLEAATFVEVLGVENLGEFGDENETVTFTVLGDGRVRKMKGTADAGTLALVVGRDGDDAGQLALRAAAKTKSRYAIKVTLDDQITPTTGNPTTFWFAAIIGSAKNSIGSANEVVKTTFNLLIDSPIYEEEAA